MILERTGGVNILNIAAHGDKRHLQSKTGITWNIFELKFPQNVSIVMFSIIIVVLIIIIQINCIIKKYFIIAMNYRCFNSGSSKMTRNRYLTMLCDMFY